MVDEIRAVSKEEVLEHIRNGTAVVINVLARRAFDDLHIKGSISIPFDILEDGELDAIGSNKNVITYCKSYTCGASMRAARLLREKGLNAMAYEGGIDEWEQSGLPVEGNNANSSKVS